MGDRGLGHIQFLIKEFSNMRNKYILFFFVFIGIELCILILTLTVGQLFRVFFNIKRKCV